MALHSAQRDFVSFLHGGRPGRRRVVGARAVGTPRAPRCAAPVPALSPHTEPWMSRPAGDLRGSSPSRAAFFSCDSNRRLFRYMRLSTKDCNSSSFVWEGTTAAGASWAGPGGRRLRGGGGGTGRAGAACGWGAAGRPASPAPLLVVQPAFPLQCCYANQVTSPPSARRVAPD